MHGRWQCADAVRPTASNRVRKFAIKLAIRHSKLSAAFRGFGPVHQAQGRHQRIRRPVLPVLGER